MNKFFKKRISTIIPAAWCMYLLCTLVGCSKDDASEGVSGKSEVLVTVNLNEASWGIEQSAGQTKAAAREVSTPVQGGVLTATSGTGCARANTQPRNKL